MAVETSETQIRGHSSAVDIARGRHEDGLSDGLSARPGEVFLEFEKIMLTLHSDFGAACSEKV